MTETRTQIFFRGLLAIGIMVAVSPLWLASKVAEIFMKPKPSQYINERYVL